MPLSKGSAKILRKVQKAGSLAEADIESLEFRFLEKNEYIHVFGAHGDNGFEITPAGVAELEEYGEVRKDRLIGRWTSIAAFCISFASLVISGIALLLQLVK